MFEDMSCNREARPSWLLHHGGKEPGLLPGKSFSQRKGSTILVCQALVLVEGLFSSRKGRPGAEQWASHGRAVSASRGAPRTVPGSLPLPLSPTPRGRQLRGWLRPRPKQPPSRPSAGELPAGPPGCGSQGGRSHRGRGSVAF